MFFKNQVGTNVKWMLSTVQIQTKKGSSPEEFTFFQLFFIGLVASDTADVSLLTAVCHTQKLGTLRRGGDGTPSAVTAALWLLVACADRCRTDLASGRTKELSEEQT